MRTPRIQTDTFVEIWPGEGQPEISILMPIFQQRRYIRDAVNSILAQRAIVAEIIISDDASSDSTFELALKAVRDRLKEHSLRHRIVMRRGTERLRRDHLALMVDNACCDLVCQAHGDDESHPDRARILVGLFHALPDATLLASNSIGMNAAGKIEGKQKPVNPQKVKTTPYSFKDILEFPHSLIGFSQAWRKSAVSRFKRLDMRLAAGAHDRILPFRAALTGDVLLVNAQLVRCRHHDRAWHNLMFDEPETDGDFGWSLSRIVALTTMSEDLKDARRMGLITEELYLQLMNRINELTSIRTQQLLGAHRVQTGSGRTIAWVDEKTMLTLKKMKSKHPRKP